MPILGETRIAAVPWEILAPHDAQAQRNHGGQTLLHLKGRGGVSTCEALAIIEDRPWRRMDKNEALRQLKALL